MLNAQNSLLVGIIDVKALQSLSLLLDVVLEIN